MEYSSPDSRRSKHAAYREDATAGDGNRGYVEPPELLPYDTIDQPIALGPWRNPLSLENKVLAQIAKREEEGRDSADFLNLSRRNSESRHGGSEGLRSRSHSMSGFALGASDSYSSLLGLHDQVVHTAGTKRTRKAACSSMCCLIAAITFLFLVFGTFIFRQPQISTPQSWPSVRKPDQRESPAAKSSATSPAQIADLPQRGSGGRGLGGRRAQGGAHSSDLTLEVTPSNAPDDV